MSSHPHPRRRRTDVGWINARENWYRDLWLVIITCTVMYLALLSADYSDQARTLALAIQHERATALRVTCAVESAVAQAGRQVIAGSTPPPPAEEKALERLGFPPFRVRMRMQERAADAYVAGIARRVDEQIGRRGDGLVQRGGTINCDRLVRLVRLN